MKEKFMKNSSQTDWDRINRMSDSDIDFSDIPETDESFWEDSEWFLPPKQDSLIDVLQRYKLKSNDIDMVVNLVERLAS